MNQREERSQDEVFAVEVISTQLQHFTNTAPLCRGIQLPDGVLLRHQYSIYLYIRTYIEDGKIKSRVFASDSPYERQKAEIGAVITTMFEPRADTLHLEKLEDLVREWVEFVKEGSDTDRDFRSFVVNGRPD